MLAVAALASCSPKPQPPIQRIEVRRLTGQTVELIPAGGQLPYCLVFTTSERGVTRQLTMTHGNRSVSCEAGKPLGGVKYRIPVEEGTVKIRTFFSDQKLNAASVAQQLIELQGRNDFGAMDLRLPGRVHLDVQTLVPLQDEPGSLGGVVNASGGLDRQHSYEPDAGR